jgi:mannosyltransferase OCH1-like enzyme
METQNISNIYLELAKEKRPEQFERSFNPNEFVSSTKYQTDFLFVRSLEKPISKIIDFTSKSEKTRL